MSTVQQFMRVQQSTLEQSGKNKLEHTGSTIAVHVCTQVHLLLFKHPKPLLISSTCTHMYRVHIGWASFHSPISYDSMSITSFVDVIISGITSIGGVLAVICLNQQVWALKWNGVCAPVCASVRARTRVCMCVRVCADGFTLIFIYQYTC